MPEFWASPTLISGHPSLVGCGVTLKAHLVLIYSRLTVELLEPLQLEDVLLILLS